MLLDDHANRSLIDFMRAVGILLVICFHVTIGTASLLQPGELPAYVARIPYAFNIMWQALGSEIVFLFSGFLLSYLLLRELVRDGRIDVRDFYIRRLSRIVPLYVVALTLYALARDFNLTELLLNLLFVSRVFGVTTIVPVGWSLEVLVQSYVLLPFVVLLFMKSGRPVTFCVVAMLAFLALRYSIFAADPVSYQTPIHALFSGTDTTATQDAAYYLLQYRATPFLLGFLCAHLVIYEHARLESFFSRRFAVFAMLAIASCLIVGSGFLPVQDAGSSLYTATGDTFWLWFWTLQRFVFSIGIGLLSLTVWFGTSAVVTAIRRLAAWPVWHRVSANIYSIYLFHPIFLIPAAVIGYRTIDRDQIMPVNILEILITILAAAALSTLFGGVTTRYVELPAQKWLRNKFAGAA